MDDPTREKTLEALSRAKAAGANPATILDKWGLLYTDERRKAAQRVIINQLRVKLTTDITPYVLCSELQGLEVTATNVHEGVIRLLDQILEELQ